MSVLMNDVRECIRDVPDFPKPGILFKDITPVLNNAPLCGQIYDWMAAQFSDIDVVVGMESRGFIFGVPVAERLGAGFVPARKAGKLPYKTIRAEYDLEYGSAAIEMHVDAISRGQRVLICDDLLATGGTANAVQGLVTQLGGVIVGNVFLVELGFLDGRTGLEGPIRSIVAY